jgi:hypothetical protein
VLVVGFAGDGRLANPVLIRERIDQYLADRRSSAARVVCGVCSLAGEAQPIFAESCIASSIPLRLMLPLPRARFLAEFDGAEQHRMGQILDHAVSIEIAGSDESLSDGLYECALQCVQQCQELLAVWDGTQSAGVAGTADILEFAKQTRRHATWIDSQSGMVQSCHHSGNLDKTSESEVDFLNDLSERGGADTVGAELSIAALWLAKLDANAARVAPEVRKLAALPIILTALAAFISASAQSRRSPGIWIAAGAVFGLAASMLPMLVRLGPRQALWVRIRTAAEVSRSMVALWATPARYKIVGPEILPELSGMVRSLDLLKSQAHRRNQSSLEEFKQTYARDRLLDQMNYFARQSTQAAKTAHQYRIVGKLCTIGAILISGWMFIGHTLLKINTGLTGQSWLSLVASALFQFATVAGALLIVKDCDRRQRRYLELHRALSDWESELRAFHTWPPVIEVVSKIERALLVELLEWRSLLQNRKMPRN